MSDNISKEELDRLLAAQRELTIEQCAVIAEGEAHADCEVAEQIARMIRALNQDSGEPYDDKI